MAESTTAAQPELPGSATPEVTAQDIVEAGMDGRLSPEAVLRGVHRCDQSPHPLRQWWMQLAGHWPAETTLRKSEMELQRSGLWAEKPTTGTYQITGVGVFARLVRERYRQEQEGGRR